MKRKPPPRTGKKKKKAKAPKKKNLSPTGKSTAKSKARASMTTAVVVRRSTRLAELHDPTVKPVLSFVSKTHKNAVKVQKEAVGQDIYFDQTATLSIDTDAPHNLAHYYDFVQLVKDGYTYESGESDVPGPYVQDGPYHPEYNNAQITNGKKAIAFKDEPGYSKGQKVVAGKWLTSYDVYFQWTVTAKYGTRDTWTSPEVHHRVTSAYNGGLDGPVAYAPEGDAEWEVNLPDRPT